MMIPINIYFQIQNFSYTLIFIADDWVGRSWGRVNEGELLIVAYCSSLAISKHPKIEWIIWGWEKDVGVNAQTKNLMY